MKGRWPTIAVALFGVALGLLIAELLLRLAFPSLGFRFPTMRITDDRFTERAGKVMDGNGVQYAFDAMGFRTADGPAPVADGPTVLFIGDSFTQGFGVEARETFPAATCDRLAGRGIRARCLNAGVTGFGTAHELRLLRSLLADARLRVDAVVFQVLPQNDLSDDWEDGGFALEGGRLVTRDPPRIPPRVRWRVALLENSFAQSSRIVQLAANAWNDFFGGEAPYDADSFELERHLLREVVATASGRQIPVVILVCATSWEVSATSSRPFDEADRLELVASAVQELGVPWIDARRVASSSEDHYIPGDGHLSAAGNALVGAALAELLAPLLETGTKR